MWQEFNMWQEVKEMIARHRWIAPAFVFCASFAWSSWFWPTLSFPDGDSFYHIKMTELLGDGIPREFPWLPFTTLAENYIDHHFLYHIFLYPFVHLLDPFVGAKLATILLIATAFTIFYCVLRSLRTIAPGFFTILLAISPAFLFRLHLAKAPPFSLIFVLLGILFLVKRKAIALAILAFLYVWAYDGWPLLPFITVIWVVSQYFIQRFLGVARPLSVVTHRRGRSPGFTRDDIKVLGAVLGGTLAGIIINPYFPKNLLFYWLHIFKIGIVNYGFKIEVGAEWYSTSFSTLFETHVPVIVGFILALILLVLEARRRSTRTITTQADELKHVFAFVVIAAIFFVLTIRARRMVDYFAPLAVLAIASLATLGLGGVKELWGHVRHFFKLRRNWFTLPAVVMITMGALFVQGESVFMHRRVLAGGYSPGRLAGAARWLGENAPDTTVFHSRWDTFPELFYWNDRARYIVGLDTTFLYVHDPERYKRWRMIVHGEFMSDVVKEIRQTFGASYAFIDRDDRDALLEQMTLSRGTHKVYEDESSVIFTLDTYE